MAFDLAARIERWRQQLLDTSRRNRLINFRAGRVGGVPLLHPTPDALWKRLVLDGGPAVFQWKEALAAAPAAVPEPAPPADDTLVLPDDGPEPPADCDPPGYLDRCLASPRLRPEHVLTELTDERLRARLTRLALNAREAEAEQGVAVLHVAFGFLHWAETPGDEPTRSPLLLVPVRLDRDDVESPWRLTAEDDLLFNHTLAQLLRADFRVTLPAEGAAGDEDDPDFRPRYLEAVRAAVRHREGWEVVDEAALGVFNFQKLAMWEDLGRNQARVAAHPLCRAIAGDPAAAVAVPAALPDERDLDETTRPQDTYHVLDADSSQHAAILAAVRGANLVLDGPPGTGKSQCIANVIAEFLAAGKTVLFVSEKAAALDVVKRRLDGCGLGDFCLELHSSKTSKRAVITELGRCLLLPPPPAAPAASGLARLLECRRQLNEYVRELHRRRTPLGLSVFEAHAALARLARVAAQSRCPVPRVLERDAAFLGHVAAVLGRLAGCRAVVETPTRHPWRGCFLTDPALADRAEIEHCLHVLAEVVPKAAAEAEALAGLGFGDPSPTVAEWVRAFTETRALLETPAVPAGWFDRDPRASAEAAEGLLRASRGARDAWRRLPEFARPVVAALSPVAAEAIAGGLAGAVEVRSVPGMTVRQRRGVTEQAAAALAALGPAADELDAAARGLAEAVPGGLRLPEVRHLRRFAQLWQAVAAAPPLLPAWWDAARREELRAVAARAQDEEKAAAAQRPALLSRLSPSALAPQSAALAAEAAGYTSLFWRLWPRWWSLRGKVAAWYLHGAPPTAALLADLKELATFHRRGDYVRQVAEQYRDLLAVPDGRPGWDATLDGLRVAEQVEKVSRSPAALRSLLGPGGALDRGRLARAADELARAEKALRERWQTVRRLVDPGDLEDEKSQMPRASAADLRDWADGQARALAARAEVVRRVVGLLDEGQDLLWAELPERLGVLRQLVGLLDQVRRLAPLAGVAGAPDELADRDWSDLASRGTGLLRWWAQFPRPHPPGDAVRRAFTDDAFRAALARVVARGEALASGGLESSWRFLTGRVFPTDEEVSSGIVLSRAKLGELAVWLAERAADVPRLAEWAGFKGVERDLLAAGVPEALAEVAAGRVAVDDAPDAFRARFLRLWVDATCAAVPALARFSGDEHERLREEFAALDREAVALAPGRVRARLGEAGRPRPRPRAGAPEGSELGTLQREAAKKRRHRPLRALFAAIPTLLPRLKPCLMMSPLAVSTYLPSPDCRFDLVIFDEASQVRPHDAICAVYRGRQLVVAGDQKQLPPTDFFMHASGTDDLPEEGQDTADQESLLDVCCALGLPRRRLRWHYRSRREGLIAFANEFVYAGELVTFPSVHDAAVEPAVRLEHLPDGRWVTGAGVNPVEARRVAALVLDHARRDPGRSLGVIAFSQRQQVRILDELEALRRRHPDLEPFFREDSDEPFFVKNLENVQGDERDVIVLSVGYGPDQRGKVAMRFGPLNQQGGERRLNVAVTRAREALTVVSSLRAADVDLGRTAAEGARLLRAYLEYADRGPAALPAAARTDGPAHESALERAVADELARRGLAVHRRVGCGSIRVDLAVVDPEAPGRYVLGVECDGVGYRTAATARDRDRLRPQVLQGLGWRLCRVWSPDWVRDPEAQVRRVLAALEAARQRPPAVAPRAPAVAPADPPAELVFPDDEPSPGPKYPSIDNVPPAVVREHLREALHDLGLTDRDDLVRHVAGRLGFERTGSKIRETIEAAIEALLATGQLLRAAEGDRVRLPRPDERAARSGA